MELRAKESRVHIHTLLLWLEAAVGLAGDRPPCDVTKGTTTDTEAGELVEGKKICLIFSRKLEVNVQKTTGVLM